MITMAITLKINAQAREYPKLYPDRPQVVTVPGPTTAAVTMAPGPIFLILSQVVFFLVPVDVVIIDPSLEETTIMNDYYIIVFFIR